MENPMGSARCVEELLGDLFSKAAHEGWDGRSTAPGAMKVARYLHERGFVLSLPSGEIVPFAADAE